MGKRRVSFACGMGALAVVASTAQRASAVSLASEDFNYTTGASVSGQAGGSGWASGWTGTVASGPTATSPGLSVGSQTGTGNKATTPDSNVGAFRIPTSSPDTDGSTVYISFLSQAASATGYAGLSLFQGATEVLFLGKPNNAANWGVDGKGAPAGQQLGGTSATTAAALLVYRIDFGGGTTAGNERVRQYVNPSAAGEPGTPDAIIADKGTFTWDNLRIQSGGGTSAQFDEIRIGTTYADVVTVPEPATAGMLGLAAAGLLAGRRRRHG